MRLFLYSVAADTSMSVYTNIQIHFPEEGFELENTSLDISKSK